MRTETQQIKYKGAIWVGGLRAVAWHFGVLEITEKVLLIHDNLHGTFIHLHESTTTDLPTIDINTGDDIYKIRIIEE